MEGALMRGEPISKVTDDILADIISRVPYKSTCCCKCVSTRWRDLISHPDHRKKMPQPLVGFFHESYNKNRFPKCARYFTNVSGEGEPLVDPSLSFLPKYNGLDILDCCNGLLLCRCWKATDPKTLDYVVCNPATERWVVVPATDWSSKVNVVRLGFEPTVSSHFHVFEFIDEETWGIDESELSDCDGCIETLAIYSSKAGVWKHRSLDIMFAIPTSSRGVFLNGALHLATSNNFIVVVGVEGNNWRLIDIPMPPYYDDAPIVGVLLSQRQLYFTNCYSGSDGEELSVWALEDCYSEKWTLKHNVSHLELFGASYSSFGNFYNVISFHPGRNMIFIICGYENMLMSYDMDRRKLCFICQLGRDCQIGWDKTLCIPYVPLYSEPLADGH
ncbi:F-box protein At5g07610-like [Lolium rigidum]|jgi:F-box interacting protein|uniref:F-box protein At5g07610-like n=1 Tax=Lolium rigidum TaxID=89674 RepID=UPI001F5D5A37|nr:F-box protein At5g07610-like [Lolium rigidum]XP_051227984.1 F-box protein At5g07610-like [Lolium perenne]